MDVKKEIEKLKLKLGEVGKNLQGSLDKILKRKKASDESSAGEEDKTKPDNPNLSDVEKEGTVSDGDGKDSGDNKKDKKKKKHNFTEQDLKRKKIIQFIVVIAIAIFLFAEDEEVVQQVQNAVKENVKKIAGNGEGEIDSGGQVEQGAEEIVSDNIDEENQMRQVPVENNYQDTNENDLEMDSQVKSAQEERPVKNTVRESIKEENESISFDFEKKPERKKEEVIPSPKKQPKKSMLDIAKKIERKAIEESKRKEYKKVNYLKVGRGLAYNCKEKYWACLNKSEYFNCRDNKEHLELNKKPKECFPLEVYSSVRDCKIIQIHNINTLKKTDFCKGK